MTPLEALLTDMGCTVSESTGDSAEVFEDAWNRALLVPQDAFDQTMSETDIKLSTSLGRSTLLHGVREDAPIMLLDNPDDDLKVIFFPRGVPDCLDDDLKIIGDID